MSLQASQLDRSSRTKNGYVASRDEDLLSKPEVFLGLCLAAHWIGCSMDTLLELLPPEVQLRFHLHFVALALANDLRTTDGLDNKAPVVMLLALDDYQTLRKTAGKHFTAACTEALRSWMSTGKSHDSQTALALVTLRSKAGMQMLPDSIVALLLLGSECNGYLSPSDECNLLTSALCFPVKSEWVTRFLHALTAGPRYGIIAMCILAGSGVETTVPDHTHELAVALPVLSFSEITNMMRNYWLTSGSSKDASRLSPDVVDRLMQEDYVRNTVQLFLPPIPVWTLHADVGNPKICTFVGCQNGQVLHVLLYPAFICQGFLVYVTVVRCGCSSMEPVESLVLSLWQLKL